MRKRTGSLEDKLFLCAVLALLALAASVLVFGSHAPANPRVRYGVHHLSAALFGAAVFTAFVGIARAWLVGAADLVRRSASFFLVVIAAVYALCWLPVWLGGGLTQDDWLLLAAASIRRSILVHPGLSWYALDSVDGNFRPLGTVLYFGFLRGMHVSPHVYTFGPFVLVLLASFVTYAIVRELGYSRIAAAGAAILFVTRGVLYTVVAWASALGDGIAILLCGLSALFLLKANRRSDMPAAFGFHLLAWGCFAVATLGKQSSFVMPLIAALILFLRPGEDVGGIPPRPRRLMSALIALVVYGATAGAVFLHAKGLSRGASPYPISVSAQGLLQTFAHAAWYLLVVALPDKFPGADVIPWVLGLAVLVSLFVVLRRWPRLLGDRGRDVLFAGLSATASLSIFILLSTRGAPYYGCMAAFWISIGLGIALTGFGPPVVGNRAGRIACIVFCVLVATGFAEIRVEQTGLVPSGGYIWGTYNMETERGIEAGLAHTLAAAPDATAVKFRDCAHPAAEIAMVLADDPSIRRILVYDGAAGRVMANDHEGMRPVDGPEGLTDQPAYNWQTPIDAARAKELMAEENVLELVCRGDVPERVR